MANAIEVCPLPSVAIRDVGAPTVLMYVTDADAEAAELPIKLVAIALAVTVVPAVIPVIEHLYDEVPGTKLNEHAPLLKLMVYPVSADPPSPFDAQDAVTVVVSVWDRAKRGAAGTVAGIK